MTAFSSAVALTRQLLAFDTINPPGRERACAELLAELLSQSGFECALHDFGEGRANLVATRRSNRPALLFTGHIDVVPLGTRPWTHEPFAGEIANGRLYGRGSSDMKSGIAAFVTAALAETERGAALTLVLTAGEETGCEGAGALARAGHLSPAGAIVVAEPTANRVCVGHKGALWLKAVTSGVTAHGSMPQQGDNAVHKGARLALRLADYGFGGARHPDLGAPTLNVGSFHGGVNVNSVPDRAEIGIDIRTVPGLDHARLRDDIAREAQEGVAFETTLDLPGIWTEPALPWVRRVDAIAAAVTGDAGTGAAPYFTDASILTPALGGPPTVILGPGEPTQAHQTDEWCELRRIDEAVEIYRRLIADWAGSP
jgi:succinyl-diaminopimelate desuccinylase